MDFSAITSAGTFTTAVAALAAVEGTLATLYVAWKGGSMVLDAIKGDEQSSVKPEGMSSREWALQQGTFDEAADATGYYDYLDETGYADIPRSS